MADKDYQLRIDETIDYIVNSVPNGERNVVRAFLGDVARVGGKNGLTRRDDPLTPTRGRQRATRLRHHRSSLLALSG